MWFVDREPVAAIIEEWIAQHEAEHPSGALETLSFVTGISARRLYVARTGEAHTGRGPTRVRVESTRVTLDFVDRLLTGIGRPDYWHTRLDGHVFETNGSAKLAA